MKMSQDKIVGNDILIEFLEVAFNNILFFRNLYPKESFVRKKIYGTAVYISQHPEIKEYITKVLIALRELIQEDENNVKKINLVIYSEQNKPIEKFVFDILKLQANVTVKDPYYLKTEEALRTICLRLSTCETYLKPLPEDSTFAVEIETFETAHIALSENSACEDFPWIIENKATEMISKNLLPLETVKTQCLTLQMYVLEDEKSKNT